MFHVRKIDSGKGGEKKMKFFVKITLSHLFKWNLVQLHSPEKKDKKIFLFNLGQWIACDCLFDRCGLSLQSDHIVVSKPSNKC